MSRRRVVVTGLGCVTPLGAGVEATWDGLIHGRSGVATISSFDVGDLPTKIAAECRSFCSEDHFSVVEAKKLDRFTQFSLVSAKQALEDSGLLNSTYEPERVGVITGTGIGGIIELEAQDHVLMSRGPTRVSPFFIPKMMANAMSGQISIKYGFQGTNFVTASACASASHAIAMAVRCIQFDEADVVLSGGAEASITQLALSGFSALKALSRRNDNPQAASRPFDRDRDGFVMGEGCAILILEERERALRRGARVYAEVLGYGSTADAFHITAPREDGLGPARAIGLALRDGRLEPSQVDYVNAHGTSTEYNDVVETRAIKKVFGDHSRKLAISSTKSMIGHLLGAAGAVGSVAAILSIFRGVVHPTLNLENADPECDLDYVPGEARERRVRYAISNSLGFGGHNVCLAFGPP